MGVSRVRLNIAPTWRILGVRRVRVDDGAEAPEPHAGRHGQLVDHLAGVPGTMLSWR